MNTQLFFRRHVLIHCHVEKTAGSSLVHAFRRWFGEHVVDLRGQGSIPPAALKPGQRAGIWVLSGHFAATAHDRAFARRCRHIACLREPAARFQSYVRYAQRDPRHPAFPLFDGKSMPEAARFAVETGHHAATNPMTRLLAGAPAPLLVPQPRLHEMLAHLAPAFRRRAVAPVRNVNPANGALDEDAATIIRAANGPDADLYDRSLERFEAWLARPATLEALLDGVPPATPPRRARPAATGPTAAT